MNKLIIYTLLFIACCSVLQAQDRVVATFDGKPITQSDVDYLIIGRLRPLQQRINEIRQAALENFIINLILEKEAKKKGLTIQGFKKSLTDRAVNVPAEEIEDSYLKNHRAFQLMNPEEIRERLRLDLVSHAKMSAYRETLEQLKRNSNITYLDSAVQKIKVNHDGPTIGSKDAKIVIVEFSDFRCQFCRQFQDVKKQILAKYNGQVRFIFKHLPLQPNSQILARASVCAGKQGRFWEYHDQLFKTEQLTENTPIQLAEELNLDVGDFTQCMTAPESRLSVLRDQDEAKRLGLISTPSFIVNGELVIGGGSLETMTRLIERQLKENTIKNKTEDK